MRLHGTLTAAKGELHGTLSPSRANLCGTLSARSVIGAELYEGAYTVHSAAHEAQELPTANKHLFKKYYRRKDTVLRNKQPVRRYYNLHRR